jgi:hypothetical protein
MIRYLQKHFHYMLIVASYDNILQALDIMIFHHIPIEVPCTQPLNENIKWRNLNFGSNIKENMV